MQTVKKQLLVFFLIFILNSFIVFSWIGGGGDATCNTISCNLSDDKEYLYTNLDFAGTTGLSDGVDNTGSNTNGTDINQTNAYFDSVQIYSTLVCTDCVGDVNIDYSAVTLADITDDVGYQLAIAIYNSDNFTTDYYAITSRYDSSNHSLETHVIFDGTTSVNVSWINVTYNGLINGTDGYVGLWNVTTNLTITNGSTVGSVSSGIWHNGSGICIGSC